MGTTVNEEMSESNKQTEILFLKTKTGNRLALLLSFLVLLILADIIVSAFTLSKLSPEKLKVDIHENIPHNANGTFATIAANTATGTTLERSNKILAIGKSTQYGLPEAVMIDTESYVKLSKFETGRYLNLRPFDQIIQYKGDILAYSLGFGNVYKLVDCSFSKIGRIQIPYSTSRIVTDGEDIFLCFAYIDNTRQTSSSCMISRSVTFDNQTISEIRTPRAPPNGKGNIAVTTDFVLIIPQMPNYPMKKFVYNRNGNFSSGEKWDIISVGVELNTRLLYVPILTKETDKFYIFVDPPFEAVSRLEEYNTKIWRFDANQYEWKELGNTLKPRISRGSSLSSYSAALLDGSIIIAGNDSTQKSAITAEVCNLGDDEKIDCKDIGYAPISVPAMFQVGYGSKYEKCV